MRNVATIAALLLFTVGFANAADQGISAKKLLLKSSPAKLVLISKDTGISITGSDPTGMDSSISFDDGSGLVTLALPKTLWSANGTGTLFKYKNTAAPGGPSVVKLVKVRAGFLKVVAKGLPFSVPSGMKTIHVTLSLDGGTNTYCMSFTGTGDGSKFLVKDASAGTCSGCGNNVREGTEECDGTDDTDCPNDCLATCQCATPCPATGGDKHVCYAIEGNGACLACCNADASCNSACTNAVLNDLCQVPGSNDACAAAANAAGCAEECCVPLVQCGNGIQEGTEECDGTDAIACPGNCLGDCTCAHCDDGVREGAEDCDNSDDALCPGNCQPDCTCPQCGNNVREGTEECDGSDAMGCPNDCLRHASAPRRVPPAPATSWFA